MTMAPSIGLNLRVTGHCSQGGRKYMEDAFVVAYQQSEDQTDLEYAYFGIFDGHGGREAALFAKEHLMNNIVCQKEFWSDDDNQVLKAIREGFLATHRAMWKEVGKWPKTVSGLPSTSGTTSSIAFIRKQKLYIGHVGDSKIVLGFQLPESDPQSAHWYATALTKDHKPESPEERKRINSVGGLVMKKSGVERVVWNRPRPDHKGPIRRSTSFDQIPFLAVARSLGDLWSYNYLRHEFVVSPEPDVEVISINPRVHRCVIFASDGLWNVLSIHSAVTVVQRAEEENERIILEGGTSNGITKQLNNPSKMLVDTALKRWFDSGMRADNTSVVTVMLDPPGPSKSEVLLKQRVMKRLRPRDEQADDEDEGAKCTVPESNMSVLKKRTIESVEPALPKEKKIEPPSKERKLSVENSINSSGNTIVPKNLPKPVILSPYKIIKSKPPSDSVTPAESVPEILQKEKVDATSQNLECDNVDSSEPFDSKVKKKGHDPPKSETSTSDSKSNIAVSVVQSDTLNNSGESLKSLSHENVNKVNSFTSSKTDVSKTNKSDGSLQTNSKENGRVHLCEVDNFVQLNNRTSDCIETRSNSKSSFLQKKDSVISPKAKSFRKSTLLRRSFVHKRSLKSTLRKSRSVTNILPCRTRAQSNIHKLKV